MKQKSIAILAMVLLIVAGTLIGGCRTVSSMKQSLDEMYREGVDGDGLSVGNDLAKITESAYTLLTVASRTIGQDSDAYLMMKNARENLLNGEEIPRSLLALREALEPLYLALQSASMSETDARFAASAKTEIESRCQTIRFDGYNDAAREFNKTLRGFPASLFALLTGTDMAPVFDES